MCIWRVRVQTLKDDVGQPSASERCSTAEIPTGVLTHSVDEATGSVAQEAMGTSSLLRSRHLDSFTGFSSIACRLEERSKLRYNKFLLWVESY